MSERVGETPAAAGAESPLPRRFLFNTNFVFLSSLTSNTIGFLTAILLARALGPEGRGSLALFQAAAGLGFAFFNMGIASAAFYFVSRGETTGRKGAERGLTVTLAAMAATAVGVLVARLTFGEELADEGIPYWLTIVAVPALIQVRLVAALMRAQGRFGAMNALDLALPTMLLVVLGSVELTMGLNAARAIWAISLCYPPLVLLGYALLGRAFWPRVPAPLRDVWQALRFGGQAQLTSLVQLLNYRVDTFMILLLIDTEAVGIYTIATSQSEGLWIIASSVAIVLLTNITAGDADNAGRLTPVVCRNTLLVTGVAAGVAAIIAGLWIPVVFGSDYGPSVLPYICLLPGTVAQSGSTILAAYVFSRGRPIINAWIGIVTLAVTLPTNLVLIEAIGVPGAALSTTLGYSLDLALTALAYRALSGNRIWEALVPRREDAAIYKGAARTAWRRLRPAKAGPRAT